MAGRRVQRLLLLLSYAQHQRNQRVEDHLKLVKPIAMHYARRTGLNRDDLIQVGCMGLIRASTRFQVNSSPAFSAFAKPHIRGAILHYLRDNAGMIRLPRRVEERASAMIRTGELPANGSDQLVLEHYRAKHHWVELRADQFTDTLNQWEELDRGDQQKMLNNAIKRLCQDDRKAVQRVIMEGASLREAGREIGVSAMTIQRRVKRGLAQLSEWMKGDQDGD